MPFTDASSSRPTIAATLVAAMPAITSARPTIASGTSQRMGLRYVINSSTATTMTVTMSRVKFAPANTPAMSTAKPSGPVMSTVSPSGRSALAVARSSAARSDCSAASVSSLSGTVTIAVDSSSEIVGGGTNPPSLNSVSAVAAAATASRSSASRAAPSVPSTDLVKTKIATVPSAPGSSSASAAA